jgi:MFS family permease
MNEPLRPLTLGEILDRTVQLYRRNFLVFAGAAAPPSAVAIAVFILIAAVAGYFARSGIQGLSEHGLALGILLLAALALLVPLELGATVVSQGALARAALSANLGHRMKVRDAIRSVWPRFWRYLGLLILQGIFVGGIPSVVAGMAAGIVFVLARQAGGGLGTGAAVGFALFLIVAAALVAIVLLLLVFSLAMPICVAEERPAWASMMRSVKLTQGTRGRIFLMFALIWVLSVLVSMLAYVPMILVVALIAFLVHGDRYQGLVLIVSEIVNVLVNFAVQVLVMPVYSTALVLFYFDQRIRTEGYDIEWMMEQAGLTGATGAGPISADATTPGPPGGGMPAPGPAGDAGAGTG